MKKKEIDQVLNSLIVNGEIIKLNDEIYIDRSNYNKALDILTNHIGHNGSIVVAEYRDLLDTNRKVALGILEYFDQMKITKRDGDTRILFQ